MNNQAEPDKDDWKQLLAARGVASVLLPACLSAPWIPLPIAAVHNALGVTRSDIVIALAGVPATGTQVVAIAADGTILWQAPGFTNATIAGDGTIVVFDGIVSALDPVTGAMLWSVDPPPATSPVVDGALTSDGKLVAVTLDGTLFGASD